MLQEMEFRLADAEMEELRSLASNDSAETMLVQRKYRHLFKRAQADAFLFKDDQFSIHPVQGTVMPFSEFEVTVRFVPNSPREQSTVAFCEVSGKTDRIPLTVKGQGDGPKAVFSYDVLDVGDTFINTLHQYEVELLNRGGIEAAFRLVPPQSTFGQHFRFEPDSGVLGVGEALPVRVLFESDNLGEFSESFSWEIKGASEGLVLDFRGRGVGPTFELDCTELDFGVVSYGFRYSLDRDQHLGDPHEVPHAHPGWRRGGARRSPDGAPGSLIGGGGGGCPLRLGRGRLGGLGRVRELFGLHPHPLVGHAAPHGQADSHHRAYIEVDQALRHTPAD